MSADEKKDLITFLTNTHETTQMMLEGVDLEQVIHQDSGWQVRDIIGHLAVWDVQATKSLYAYCEGGEYAIPEAGNENVFNEKECAKQKKLTTQQVLEEWERSHEEFKKAVSGVPDDKYTGNMLYPWGGEYGDVPLLVKYMCEHEVEHREEIRKAFGGG